MLHPANGQTTEVSHYDYAKARLVVQDYAEEPAIHRHAPIASIVHKAEFPELIHELAHPRSSSADHLCQVLLAYSRMQGFSSALLPEVGEQQEHSSQTFLAGVKKLVNQITLEPDVA